MNFRKGRKLEKDVKSHEGEIDFSEYIRFLRRDWWILILSSFVFLVGSAFVALRMQPVYEANIAILPNNLPPFYSFSYAKKQFTDKFLSKAIFNKWSTEQKSVKLEYDDFGETEVLDGYTMLKDDRTRKAKFVLGENNIFFLVIRSNDLELLKDFRTYGLHISKLVTNEFLVRSNDELRLIQERFNRLASSNTGLVTNFLTIDNSVDVLPIDRYQSALRAGGNAFRLKYPTRPVLTSTPPYEIVLAFTLVGSFLGLIIIFFKYFYEKFYRSRDFLVR